MATKAKKTRVSYDGEPATRGERMTKGPWRLMNKNNKKDFVGSLIDTIKRPDGSRQLTYKGHPLYTLVDDAQPLGIEFSRRRFVELLLGLFAGFIFTFSPFLIALLSGTMFVHDRVTAHFDNFQAFQIIAVGFFLLFLQSVMEETANRAFPLRIWEKRPLVFRLIVPSLFFALIHLADENFSYERLAILFAGGVIQSFAYLLTGNIWFTSGIHTGANFATFSASGLWHAGAIVALVGRPAYPNWLAVAFMFLFLSILFLIFRRKN